MPRNKTLPALGDKSPDTILIKVVLPAPLGPMTACSSPTSTSRDTLSTAARPPKFLVNPRTLRIGSIIQDPRSPNSSDCVGIIDYGGQTNRPTRPAGPARQARSSFPSPT